MPAVSPPRSPMPMLAPAPAPSPRRPSPRPRPSPPATSHPPNPPPRRPLQRGREPPPCGRVLSSSTTSPPMPRRAPPRRHGRSRSRSRARPTPWNPAGRGRPPRRRDSEPDSCSAFHRGAYQGRGGAPAEATLHPALAMAARECAGWNCISLCRARLRR
jgi:hypothetical protein